MGGGGYEDRGGPDNYDNYGSGPRGGASSGGAPSGGGRRNDLDDEIPF